MNYIKSHVRFMVDNGLIFEINRKVLHPLGLALIADVDLNNKKHLKLYMVDTEDENGFVYDDESFVVGKEVHDKFLITVKDRLISRENAFGFVVQEK